MELGSQLDLLLMTTLAATGPAHGYALIAALRTASAGAFDLAEGTVYPALHRLERAGNAHSAWSTESGRRRRVYRLTAAGEAALVHRRREWLGFAEAMNRVQAVLPIGSGPGAVTA